MSKDPAFLFYPSDFLTGTQFFTDEQVGRYVRLLLAQHQHGHLTEKEMMFICHSHDEQIFSKFKQDDLGHWFNERLEFEINKRKIYSKSRADNRQKNQKKQGGEKVTYDSHMENRNENENINEIKNATETENGKRGAGEKTKTTPEAEPDLNPFQGELAQVWKDWEQHRKEKKAPLTPVARQRQIKLLKAMTTIQAVEVISYSLDNGYTGLFPEQLQKEKTNGKYTNAKQQSDAQRRDYLANYIRDQAERKKL